MTPERSSCSRSAGRPRRSSAPHSTSASSTTGCWRMARSRSRWPAKRWIAGFTSHGEPEVEDVPVLDDVVLALDAELSFLPRLRFAAHGDEVVVVDDLGADEPPLEVGVDACRRARRTVSPPDGPGAYLVLADGEERDQIQQVVRGPNEPRPRRLGQVDGREELRLLGRIQLGDFRLQRRAERQN